MPLRMHSRPGGMRSLKVIDTDNHTATISDHGMIVACMAVLKDSGMDRLQAVPIYARLLEHHGLTKEAIAADLPGALAHLPSKEIARSHLLEVCPELGGEI